MIDEPWAGTLRRRYAEGLPVGVSWEDCFGFDRRFSFGVNAVLWNDREAIIAELERVIPALKEGGGRFFSSDHSIPNTVSFDNFKTISDCIHRLGKY